MKKLLLSLVAIMSSLAVPQLAYSYTELVVAISNDLKTVISAGPYNGKSAEDNALTACRHTSQMDCWIGVKTTGPHQCISIAIDRNSGWVGSARWEDLDQSTAQIVANLYAIKFCADLNGHHQENCELEKIDFNCNHQMP